MRRMIGFLMLVGLMVGVVGCGDDDNPAKSSEDVLDGTWVDQDGDEFTFTSDGVFIDDIGDRYTWTIEGDMLEFSGGDEYYGTYSFQLTADKLTINDPDEDFESGNPAIFRRVGDDDNSVKSNQDLLVGTWLDEDGDSITLRSDGTFVDYEGDQGTWSLVGDQLTIAYNDEDYGSVTATLDSVTDTEFTVIDEDGERYVSTRQT